MNSFGLIESLSGRTLIRLTAVKDLNIKDQFMKDYAKIIENVSQRVRHSTILKVVSINGQ